EAVAADWMLEFACYCLCRHFAEECTAEFRRWRDVAQAVINGFSKTAAHQKKKVYLCQFLIRIAQGRRLECSFEKDTRISPLESALSYWTLLEEEESKLDTLHEDIYRLIKIQVVAVYMEKGYYKQAAEVLERVFTDSESDKSLRVKMTTIVRGKDPYVPLLQNFSFNRLISKVKSYVERFMKKNETNFLLQAATEQAVSAGAEVTTLQDTTVDIQEEKENYLEIKQRFVFGTMSLRDMLSLKNLQNLKEHGDDWACGRRRQPWTYEEDRKLKSGIREFGVGNWAKILAHGDFNNRTSVMLKDRWRTLCKIK
ncbi:TERF1 factor, partial [Alectura lathami]|nr:TERF1 factor [Alectura lathami]